VRKEKVLETMKSGGKPLQAREIAERSGLDKKEVDKTMKALKTEELIGGHVSGSTGNH
jgi:DNA-binding IscR family transcriptional regulator